MDKELQVSCIRQDMKKHDILDLAVSNKEKEFVDKALEKDLDVAVDIVQTMADIPYVGSVVKLGMIGSKYMEYRFVRKLAIFLSSDKNISLKEKERFISNLTHKDRKKIHDYVVQYILRAEDDEKAELMGFLYSACVMKKIDNSMFLRLCSIVDHAFIDDLHLLAKFTNSNERDLIAANNFVNLGLIDNYVGGIWRDNPSFQLNDVGLTLYNILSENNWC